MKYATKAIGNGYGSFVKRAVVDQEVKVNRDL